MLKELTLSNLDKVFWPKEGYTKGDLIQYYDEISKYILPYLKNRPQSLLRYPNGIENKGFFQKDADKGIPDWLTKFQVEHEGKTIDYLIINDKESLLFAINLGCIDLHPFHSNIKHINEPDYLVIDLDPEDISFDEVVKTAQEVHNVLKSADIPSFCKTSGATGLHIYVPVKPKYSYEQVKQFAQLIVEMTHIRLPHTTSIERSPKNRQKRVYLDFLQNNFGQTLASVYSVRPRPGATVSTPLDWSEVKSGLDPRDFTMKNTLKRLQKKGDLFSGVLHNGIDIKKSIEKL